MTELERTTDKVLIDNLSPKIKESMDKLVDQYGPDTARDFIRNLFASQNNKLTLLGVEAYIDHLVEQKDATAIYNFRITWREDGPYLQRCPYRKTYDTHGELVRKATQQDLDAMYSGYLSYDPETDPFRKAWEKHVQEGGD